MQNNDELNIKFRKEFDKFEKFIQEKYHIEKITNDFIEQNLISPSTHFWKAYRNLRNMLSHGATKYIANITQKGLDDFTKEVKYIINPLSASDICIKRPFTVKDNDNLAEVLKIMKDNNYTNAPIIDENFYTIGVFNSHTIFSYINNNPETVIDIPKTQIDFFKPLYEINNDSELVYCFVSEIINIYEIQRMFNEYKQKGQRLEAIFVTKNGTQHEKIIGIITPWDMIKYFKK